MAKKLFINKLNEDQLKTLIILGFAEEHRIENYSLACYYDVKYLEDLKIIVRDFYDLISVDVWNLRGDYRIGRFYIDDFSMIYDDEFETDLSYVLKKYLANQFNQDYINYLYETKLNEAEEEKKMLLKESPNILEMYKTSGFFEEKKLSDGVKVKTIERIKTI